MRVSSYSESIEHEVHFVLCELPFMLIDFQIMLERNQWYTASTRSTSPSIYTQPRQRLGCVKVCICTCVLLNILHIILYQIIPAKVWTFWLVWGEGLFHCGKRFSCNSVRVKCWKMYYGFTDRSTTRLCVWGWVCVEGDTLMAGVLMWVVVMVCTHRCSQRRWVELILPLHVGQ